MAKIHKREIKKLYGLSDAYITVYVKRGNLVVDKDGYVDDEHPVNVAFMAKRVGKTKPSKQHGTATPAKAEKLLVEKIALVDEKTQADIERIRTVTELNRLKIEKQEGENIPTELVMPLVSQFAHSMIGAFKNGMEAMLVEIGHKKKLTNAEMADLRKVLTATINRAASDGVEDARKATGNIVNEFIEKRGKGERL
jgi:hypothetical protein